VHTGGHHLPPQHCGAALQPQPAHFLLALTATAPHRSSASVISATCRRPPLFRADHLHLQHLLCPVLHRACAISASSASAAGLQHPLRPLPGAPTTRGPLARGYSEETGDEAG
jgi:hypothetical protein